MNVEVNDVPEGTVLPTMGIGGTEKLCRCCPTCGALPEHQNPPTGKIFQHTHYLTQNPKEL